MSKLNLSKEYYSVILEMAECAIQDRISLIDAYRTEHVKSFEEGARYDGAQEAYEQYVQVKETAEITIKDFISIKKYAEYKLK